MNGDECQYRLKGIVYFGSGHYVTRLIAPNNSVWFHDGIETGRNMVMDGTLTTCDLQLCRGKSPAVYIYVLQ